MNRFSRFSRFSFGMALVYALLTTGCGGDSSNSGGANVTPSSSAAIPVIDSRVGPALPDTQTVIVPSASTDVVLQANPGAVPEPESTPIPAPVGGGGGGASTTPPVVVVPPPSTTPVTSTVTVAPTTGVVAGQVIDAYTGAPIAGAQIDMGSLSTTTDAGGRYQFIAVNPVARMGINISSANYAPGLAVASVVAATTMRVQTKLVPVGLVSANIVNAVGGTVALPSSLAKVTLPPYAFDVGITTVTLELTYINPTVDSFTLPGDFTANNGTQSFESFGALVVTARDTSGNVINLAPGQTAVIRIPATRRHQGPLLDNASFFSLAPTATSWKSEGTATLGGLAVSDPLFRLLEPFGFDRSFFYEANVSQLGIWSANTIIDDSIRLSGCVRDASGLPVSGATVHIDGVNNSYASSFVTRANGAFSVPIKNGYNFNITAFNADGQVSNTLETLNRNRNYALPACLILSANMGAVNIRLTMGSVPGAVKPHLITPSGHEIFKGNTGSLTISPFVRFEFTNDLGHGPEVITAKKLMVGTYRYVVDNVNFADLSAGRGLLGNSPIHVELYGGGIQQFFSAPPGPERQFLRLFNFTVDSACNITVVPINQWSDAHVPSVASSIPPVYCVRP